MSRNNQRVKSSTIFISLIILAGLYVLGAGTAIYVFGTSDPISKASARIIPYPAATVGMSRFVTISELEKNLQSARKFYENQDFSEIGARVDFSTSDGQKRLMIKKRDLLNKMIENKIIEMLSKERGISISADLISQEVSRKMQEFGSREEVKDKLFHLYGWDLNDFEKKIVRPQMYKDELEKYTRKENADIARAKNKIEQALAEMESGGDFSVIAEKYSEGESAKNKGELGWFSADQMIPPIAAVAFSVEKGKRSGIIESALGYHIIQAEDKKTEDNVEKVKLKQVFVRVESFSDWLLEKEKELSVHVLLKDFFWNQKNGVVDFQDEKLREFSENLDQNSQGDISVIF